MPLKLFCKLFYDKMITIVKNYNNLFRNTIIQIPYTMGSTCIFTCIMAMTSKFMIFFYLLYVYLQPVLYKNSIFSCFHMVLAVRLLTTSFFCLKSIILIVRSLKDSKKIFKQSYLFGIIFLGVIFAYINLFYQRFKICINDKWCND